MPDCIYLRKSRIDTEAEANGAGDTLVRHEQALLRHGAYLGRSITHIYREIVSGETISARPQMQQLLRDVEAGVWDAVHVMEVERLARGDTLDQGIVSQAFLYSKTLIITPKKTYDPSNEFDEEYFEFGLFMSRREYKTINRRQQAGRIASMREGKWVSNRTPYGYQRVKLEGQKGWTLEPQEPQACVVRDIFRWATEGYTEEVGNSHRLGTALIARRLNEIGIPSPTGRDWLPNSVRDLLHNEVYAGWICWGRRATQKNFSNGVVVTSRPRVDSASYQRFCGIHTKLIEQEVFDLTQKLLGDHPSRPGPKQAVTKNPLAGLVICGGCGRAMVRRPYPSGRQDTLLCPYTSCKTISSDLHIVEDVLLSLMADLLKALEVPEYKQPIDQEKEQEALRRSVFICEKELALLIAQEKRAYELVEQQVYTADQFKMRGKELAERKQELQRTLASIKAELQQRANTQAVQEKIAPRLRHVLDSYQMAESPAAKNELLRSVLLKVMYTKSTGSRYRESNMRLTLFPRMETE